MTYVIVEGQEKNPIWTETKPMSYEDMAKLVKELKEGSEEMQKDNVNQPNHYTVGGIEVIDYIRAKLTTPQLKGYYVGNLLKYISRAEHKNGVEDLKKAEVYLKWLIELTEKQGMSMED